MPQHIIWLIKKASIDIEAAYTFPYQQNRIHYIRHNILAYLCFQKVSIDILAYLCFQKASIDILAYLCFQKASIDILAYLCFQKASIDILAYLCFQKASIDIEWIYKFPRQQNKAQYG